MINTNDLLKLTDEEIKGILDGTVDTIDYERIATKILNDYTNTRLYGGLTHNYNLNRDTKIEPLEYENKIGYNLKGKVKEMLTKRGMTFLLIANAGGGKTYVMLQVSAELVEKNKANNVVYILSVPNTSQSNQNQVSEDLIEFGFESVVGKKSKLKIDGEDKSITERLKEGHRKFSCVYDKTLEIIEEAKKLGLEVVLVVDEAHKLVYDTYRGVALQGMDKAIEMADMVIMMTATADVCKCYYPYDVIYDLEDKKLKNNIGELKIIYSNNWELTLRRELRRLKQKGKIALVRVGGSVENLHSLKTALEKQGYVVEVLSSKNKNDETFKMIEKYGLIGIDEYGFIGEGVDVVLTTPVIECGISLKDANIVPIEIIRGANDFNADNTTQFFARPREAVSEGIMIVKNYSDDIGQEIVDLEAERAKNPNKVIGPKIKVRKLEHCINEVRNQANSYYRSFEATMKKKLKTDYLESVKEYMLEELRTDRSKSIELDVENMKLYINTKSVIKEAIRRRDAHIINATPLSLETFFKGRIFYDKVTLDIDLGGNVNEEDLENVKIGKEEKKAVRELKQAKEEEYRAWFTDKNFLKALQALVDGTLNRANIKNYKLNMSLRDLIEFKSSSLYDVMLTCLKHFTIGETGIIISSRYKTSGEYITKSDIKDICKRKHIVEKVKVGYYEDLDAEYDIICDIVQTHKTKNKTQAPKQINITDEMIVIINAELNRNNCKGYRNAKTRETLKKIKKGHKGKIDWKTFYTEEKIKELKTAISNSSNDIKTSLKNKIINEIGKIYNVTIRIQDGNEYYRINNPHKNFKLDITLEEILSSK